MLGELDPREDVLVEQDCLYMLARGPRGGIAGEGEKELAKTLARRGIV